MASFVEALALAPRSAGTHQALSSVDPRGVSSRVQGRVVAILEEALESGAPRLGQTADEEALRATLTRFAFDASARARAGDGDETGR